MIDLLIPVVKAYSTDIAFRLTEWAIQIHGGYGFVEEFPIERAYRDSRILEFEIYGEFLSNAQTVLRLVGP